MVRTPLGFCVDSTEVTRDQYSAWLASGPPLSLQPAQCAANATFQPDGSCMADLHVWHAAGSGQHPQVCVNWCQAFAYCAGVGKHLCGKIGGGSNPSMGSDGTSEWVQACSSGGTHQYPYGSPFDPTACIGAGSGGSGSLTKPVASKSTCQSDVSVWAGVFDMSGNVSEWENACDTNGDCRVRGCNAWCNPQALACNATFSGSNLMTSNWGFGFRCCAD